MTRRGQHVYAHHYFAVIDNMLILEELLGKYMKASHRSNLLNFIAISFTAQVNGVGFNIGFTYLIKMKYPIPSAYCTVIILKSHQQIPLYEYGF